MMSERIDQNDFLDAMEGVEKLDPGERMENVHKTEQTDRMQRLRDHAQNHPPEDANPFLDYVREYVKPDEFLEWKLPGVQPGDFKNLQLGIYLPNLVLDLHHKSIDETRTELWDFLNAALESEERTVKVVHGRGLRSEPQAVLKSYVVQCLRSHPDVIAYCTAPSNLGGTGATFVQVRKSETERERTREELGLKSDSS